MIQIFIGYDPRQPVAYNVCQHSIVTNASKPVQITPLILSQLPIERRGLTEFTYSRFLVPYLSDFKGVSIYMDPDIIVTGDVYELLQYEEDDTPVWIMQEQEQFEWSSVMVFENSLCEILTPDFIEDDYNDLFDFDWVGGEIGELPKEWNHTCFYKEPIEAKLYHFTVGIPVWDETREVSPETSIWKEYFDKSISTVSWKSLMGDSVHTYRRIDQDTPIKFGDSTIVYVGKIITGETFILIGPENADYKDEDENHAFFVGMENPDGEEEHVNVFFNLDEATSATKQQAEKIKGDSWEVLYIDFADRITSKVI